jgi:type II secretory pathway predicted ATPase ExeA
MSATTARKGPVEGTTFAPTPAYQETLIKASEMATRYGILLVTGPPGVGKTETCKQVMADIAGRDGIPGLWVQLGTKPNPKEVVCQLMVALGMRPKRTEPTWVLMLELVELLAVTPRTVWIDDAHNLRADAFTTIRTLHDRPDAKWTLGLIGTQLLAKRLISDQPELLSRVGRRVEMDRLRVDRLLVEVLAAWHPLLAGCATDRLLRMDRTGPKGNFRAWDELLATLVRLAAASGGLSEEVEAVALRQCGYTLPAELARWLRPS